MNGFKSKEEDVEVSPIFDGEPVQLLGDGGDVVG